jgi:hypothetical protein
MRRSVSHEFSDYNFYFHVNATCLSPSNNVTLLSDVLNYVRNFLHQQVTVFLGPNLLVFYFKVQQCYRIPGIVT